MNKVWHIITFEYRRHVLEKRFLFSLLSLPVAVIAMVGVSLLVMAFTINASPVGYIDQSGILTEPVQRDDNGGFLRPVIDFRPYQDEDKALADMEEGEIQAYYVIPNAYPESLEVQLVFLDEPDSEIYNQFNRFILQNLETFKNLDPQVEERIQDGSRLTMADFNGSREMREDQWFMIFTPIIAGILFIIVVMTSGGYLLQAVVAEKENRTMEILITSVTPGQLMSGKILGNISVGLTQLLIWLLFGWISITVGRQFFPFLQDFTIPTDFIIVLFMVLLPSFVMVAAIMAAIGSTMTETNEAQQVSGIFSMLITIPFYLTTPIMMNPNSTLAIVLSYFPLTAPITILMRMGFTTVPVWQIAINITILVAFAGLGIWFAGRVFRMGMLRYGKKLSLKEMFGMRENS